MIDASQMITNVAIACDGMSTLLRIASETRPTQRDELIGLTHMLAEVQHRCEKLAPEPPRIQRVVPKLLVASG
jgi:hypothetical protein